MTTTFAVDFVVIAGYHETTHGICTTLITPMCGLS